MKRLVCLFVLLLSLLVWSCWPLDKDDSENPDVPEQPGEPGDSNGGDSIVPNAVVLRTTEDVQAFAARGLKKLKGSLIVEGKTLGSLTALNNQLEEISDSLIINCSSFTSFDGLYGLKRIGGNLTIKKNKLASFEGLNNLEYIGGSFRIAYFYDWKSLKLNSLVEIGGDFISKSDRLYVNGLKKLATVGGEMNVRLNTSACFTALQSVGGALSLSSSSNLDLPALKTVGGAFEVKYFTFVDIPKLESIEGAFTITKVDAIGTLDNLKTVGDITIQGPWRLTDFCNWKPVLMNYNGTFSVSGCKYNPTKYQILNGACSK